MNKQDLLNKLAAKKAAQEVKQTNVELSPLKSFTIHWSEAGSFHDGLICTNWEAANDAMKELWNNVSQEDRTYYHKTKVTIEWMNGAKVTDRLDLGTGGDFNPDECTIQDYVKEATSAMYESNLQVGDRTKLSWSDADAPAQQVIQEIEQRFEDQHTEPTNDIPTMLKQLIGIVETIEEANDSSDAALIKASEQVERCEYYLTYLQSILPILRAKTNKMIEAKHVKKVSINVNSFNSHLN